MSTKRSIVNHVHRTSLILAASLLASSLATGARADAPAGVPASAVPSATVLSTSAPSASVALTGPQVGAPAPAFALQTLDGKTIGLESYRGKTLVVNVWATWCPPCREEMPVLAAAARKASPGVVFLGVDTTERAQILRAFTASKNVPYLLALDRAKSFTKAYDIQYFPTTYVIDSQGIIRARYVDELTAPQLAAFVSAAQAGRDGDIASHDQAKIDATLADPAIAFTGDAAAIEASAKRAEAAVKTAEDILNNSDSSDFIRTRAEEAALLDKAVAALASLATPPADSGLLPRLRGDAAFDREQWQGAIDAYRAALAVDPKNEDVLGNLALAGQEANENDVVIDADTQLAALDPTDPEPLVDLARAQQRAGARAQAYATFRKAVVLAEKRVAARPRNAHAIRILAWTHLYFGRTYASNGDAADARAEFAQTLTWAQKLPARDERHDMYIEEGQEALAALEIGTPRGPARISLAPWTGAGLPGSTPGTIKYRLVVAGGAGRTVALATAHVPKGWVASFCSDRLCAPFRTSVAVPDTGVKVVEFQLVAPFAKAPMPRVRVTATDGSHESAATT